MTWYLIGAPFLLLTGTLGRGFMALQRFKLLATLAVLTVFVNIVLNFVFIDFFGIMGVAVSTTALDGLLSCAYYFIGNRLSRTRKNLKG
jgi:peptidoglycan biosynthesis protein MviN/MurJ (putative lipid II flippase)